MADETQKGPVPKPAAKETINDELVEVFDSEDESEARVVKGLLESAGIDALISSLDIPQDVIPVGGVVVRVRAEDAEDAAKIIEESRNAPPAENDDATDAA
jgi:Putative prokaryotic signal transducing protein